MKLTEREEMFQEMSFDYISEGIDEAIGIANDLLEKSHEDEEQRHTGSISRLASFCKKWH